MGILIGANSADLVFTLSSGKLNYCGHVMNMHGRRRESNKLIYENILKCKLLESEWQE